MRILVFGLGALGTVYSCLLHNQGHEITGVDHPAVVEKVKEHGVRVTGIWGEHQAYLKQVVSKLEDMDESSYDLVIISVKSYETGEVAAMLKNQLSDYSYVLLAQNGYGNFESAARFLSPQKIILGRVILDRKPWAGFSPSYCYS